MFLNKKNKTQSKDKRNFIFIIGGVMSGIGKGVVTGSMAAIMDGLGYRVNIMKVDPYLNIDAGTMNPTEHGEVFVLDSGLECDQDMGNYERFLHRDLSANDYVTSGMIYRDVLKKERELKYEGKCVEAIPHVVDEIKGRFELSAEKADAEVQFVELGGTVGDFQNSLFFEAVRSMQNETDYNAYIVFVVPFPTPEHLGEMKTRPAQIAIRSLSSYALQPDIIIARGQHELDDRRKEKISNTCNIEKKFIISSPDVDDVHLSVVDFKDNRGVGDALLEKMNLKKKKDNGAEDWKRFVSKTNSLKEEVLVAITGKYFDTGDFVLADAYHSVINALKFSGIELGVKVKISYLDTKNFEKEGYDMSTLNKYDAIIVPGGFGATGIDGKLNIIKHAREQKIPFLGICYGAQLAVVEFARNVLNHKKADTMERDINTPHPVVHLLAAQEDSMKKGNFGGTMRLGSRKISISEKSLVYALYETNEVYERHRHRYYINLNYMDELEKNGFESVGTAQAADGSCIVEILELKEHPFFIGVQYHPEFTARPFTPNPLYTGFIAAAIKRKAER